MKKILFFLLLTMVLSSCFEENQVIGPSTTVNLNFQGMFNGEVLKTGTPYTYGGKQISFNQLNFFVADVVLLQADSDDEIDLFDLSYVNLTDTFGQPVTVPNYKVPAGDYKGIRISFGVPSGLNRSAVSSYGAGHPLKVNFDTHYWDDAKSFIFLKSEGTFDLDGDGQFEGLPQDHPFAHGPAKNSNYATLVLTKSITLNADQPYDLNVLLDMFKLYDNGTEALDFASPDALNTADPDNQDGVAAFLMGNLQYAVSLEP